MFLLLGILSSLAVWQYAFASNCPVVQEEFRNGIQTSSTGYRLNSYFPDHEYYIPQCTAGGLFEKIQCTSLNQSVPTPHRNPSIQCWCVDPVTGISVDLYGGSGPKNESECDNTISINTTALCEGKSTFPLTPGSCIFNDCSIGPPATLIVDCFYPRCLPFQRVVSGPECCDFTCVGLDGSICEIKGQIYYPECAPCDGTCENPNVVCPMICKPGCACPVGQVIKDGKSCVNKTECPPVCEIKGQIYYPECAPCDGTCENPNPKCPKICKPGCACPEGKVIKNGKKCVKPTRCPSEECDIKGQIYYPECAPCDGTCENPNPPCPEICEPGCACRKGKVIKNGRRCVNPKNC